MRYYRGVLLFLCCMSLSSLANERERLSFSIGATIELIDIYLQATKNSPCYSANFDYSVVTGGRGVIDLIVICRALHYSGYQADITMRPTSGYMRSLKMSRTGVVDMSAEAVWLDDIDKTAFFYTDAVIHNGDYVKGIYTIKDHPLQQQEVTPELLQQYVGVSIRNWHKDWEKLNQLSSVVTSAASYESIFKMLNAGRADFTLLEFGYAKRSTLEKHNVTLYPLKNIKVILPGSRHFAINKESKVAKKLILGINKGLKALKASGQLRKIYQQAGFYIETDAKRF